MTTSLHAIAAVSILLLPIMVSVWLRRIAVTCAANGITAPWVKAAAWLRFATVMVVPGWWSYADSVVTYRNMSPIVPLWILLIFPPCASVYVAPGPKSQLSQWGTPVASHAVNGLTTFDLHGRTGTAVLVWITDLGRNQSVSVGEATLAS